VKILVTNWRLARRTGTELHAGEIARGLHDRGHEVALYSPVLGDLADKLRADGIDVHGDLSQVNFTPDVIHAQHHMTTMAALAHFPKARAVYQCHGTVPWEEWPPQHPRILFYCGPADDFREWFENQHGVTREKFRKVSLAVDLTGYPVREKVQWPPKRALIFSDYFERGPQLDAIAAVCKARGIKLDAKGRAFGSVTDVPETLLPQYDLVFAAGRSALEATACGCATVITRSEYIDGWVFPKNLTRLAELNFSPDSKTQKQVTEETIEQELDSISTDSILAAARQVHANFDLSATIDQLLEIYAQALAASLSDENEDGILIAYLEKISHYIVQADDKFRDLRTGWERTKLKRSQLSARFEQEKAEHAALVDFLQKSRAGRAQLRKFKS
jgi:hypothetical protein